MHTTHTPDHLFVKNPISGKLVNLMPLFRFMSDDELNDGPDSVSQKIQQVHDFLSTNVPQTKGTMVPVDEWAESNYWLVEMRKVFERMKEVPA